MCYEFGIFSTYFVGEQVPSWLAYRSEGSSISISMRSSKNIRGLNISSVHTCLGTSKEIVLVIKIRNVTKARTWVYFSAMCVTQEADEDIVWLSHWMLNNNEFEDGDEVYVSVFEDEEDGIFVKQCAISPMYTDSDNEDDPLSYYKSWKQIIGGDLSYFQLTSEEYFLFHLRSVWADYIFELNELFDEIKAVERFFGYKPQYKRYKINSFIFLHYSKYFMLIKIFVVFFLIVDLYEIVSRIQSFSPKDDNITELIFLICSSSEPFTVHCIFR